MYPKTNLKCRTTGVHGKQEVMMKIQMSQGGGAQGGQPDMQQVQEAMKDPEIQQIMKDPQVNMVLQKMQEDPKAAQAAMKDPQIANAINKLVLAGIVRIG